MSYDVYLVIRTGVPAIDPDEWGYRWDGFSDVWASENYTSNCARMWREAGCDIADYDDRPSWALGDALEPAIALMRAEPERFIAMNPENGWGSYDSVLPWLDHLLAACQKHIYTNVRVSR